MKKYIDAQLQVVRMNSKDIVTASQLGFVDGTASSAAAGDRFRDWED